VVFIPDLHVVIRYSSCIEVPVVVLCLLHVFTWLPPFSQYSLYVVYQISQLHLFYQNMPEVDREEVGV
jgi:hypothetical protein